VPAYVIFSDVSLREMARNYPTIATEFRRIPGVGEQKLKDFGEAFLGEIKNYLAANPRRTFSGRLDPLDPPRRTRLNQQSETSRT
jgi:ATP-dependent DNA helicase RecQ